MYGDTIYKVLSKNPLRDEGKKVRLSWIVLFLLAVMQGFSQPSLSLLASAFSSCLTMGLALYFLCQEPSKTRAVFGAWIWFFLSQMIQFYWMLSHPYFYIYFVWVFAAALYALPFSLLCFFVYDKKLTFLSLFALAGGWTLMEWGRLFILSGASWNPVGLSLSGFDSARQLASWIGVYGLSFLVVFANICFFVFAKKRTVKTFFLWLIPATFPYVLGQLVLESRLKEKEALQSPSFTVALVQTGFPANGGMGLSFHEMISLAFSQWDTVFSLSSPLEEKAIELLVLPEFAIPFPRTFYLYPYGAVKRLFAEYFPSSVSVPYPNKGEGKVFETEEGPQLFVTNGYMMRALSYCLKAPVVCGMEELVEEENDKRHYSSAIYVDAAKEAMYRYDKRILVPMGEYIPFSFLRTLASRYGIGGSFTPGAEARVIDHQKVKMGICICYEETFGNLMRENKQLGASLLVNLTSDVWYPNSTLPWQHFDHARLRTVEMGLPLVRSCNTSVTTSLDSLGRIESLLGNGLSDQFTPGVLVAKTSLYAYPTVYSITGDLPVVLLSFLFVAIGCRRFFL